MLGQRRRRWYNIKPELSDTRCSNVESTSMTLIQRRNNVVCPVGCLPVSAGAQIQIFGHFFQAFSSSLGSLIVDEKPVYYCGVSRRV